MTKSVSRSFLTFGALILITQAQAQLSGKKAFAFLNMQPSARQVALGSNFISSLDNDLSQAWNNPAAVSKTMHNHALASYNNYILDINAGYFAYSRTFEKAGSFALGVLYTDYGKFDGYTPAGISTGTFTAKDQCFHLSWGQQWKEKIRFGASIKYIYSIYESLVSNGLSSDVSAIYADTAKRLQITAFARNIGFQAIPYSGTERQGLPFELALTLSKKLAHLPFRYHLIASNLQAPDMRYTIRETGEKDENGQAKVKEMGIADNVLRHFSIGGEMLFSKNFVFRFGYNHQRRREMSQEQKRGFAGFSWGLGIKISKFSLSYGSAGYFPGYSSKQFTLMMNLEDFRKK